MEDKILLILLDIDGTLLNSNNEISKDTFNDIKFFSNMNRIVLTSARKPSSVHSIYEQLRLNEKIIICYNGALILNNNEIISEHPLSTNQVSSIYKIAKKLDISINIYSYDSWYVENIDTFIEYEAEIISEQPIFLSVTPEDLLIHKILLIAPEKKLTYVQKYLYNMKDILTVHSKKNYLEITNSKGTKKCALDFLIGYLSIDAKDTLAIGDGLNDIDLLKAAGIGVAMGNAPEKVKKAADFITCSNNKNGVGYALRNYVKKQGSQ